MWARACDVGWFFHQHTLLGAHLLALRLSPTPGTEGGTGGAHRLQWLAGDDKSICVDLKRVDHSEATAQVVRCVGERESTPRLCRWELGWLQDDNVRRR